MDISSLYYALRQPCNKLTKKKVLSKAYNTTITKNTQNRNKDQWPLATGTNKTNKTNNKTSKIDKTKKQKQHFNSSDL